MDDLHQSDNWPFVVERKPVPKPSDPDPVSPEVSDEEEESDYMDHEDGDDVVDGARVSDDGHAASVSPTEVSPLHSSRNSLEQDSMLASDVPVTLGASHEVDELYEDDDEERDAITPIPSSGLNKGAEHTNPLEADAPTARIPPMPSPQSRTSSILKVTAPPHTLLRRTPSITAQGPLNRQRVRYSWQSEHTDEPNRPRINVIKLVSNTATASAGFPQGEAFGFSISPAGRRIAAYNSARLYILQSQALPVGISQDYALKRRPLAVEIVDEGNAIAILADEYTVNVYDLENQLLQRIKTIKLDNPTTCIALSPTGGLLAAGYEGGVEIFSLAASALATDRRAVRSQKVDRLKFSRDASTLIGTTTRINASSTVVISVPVFPTMPSGIPTHEELKVAWCTELLQPENIRNSSHATFMCENREPCNDRLFAWNGLQETFGILRIPDMMYSTLDFPVVINPPLSTLGGLGAAIHSCPDVDENGDAVAMIVNDRTIRLYLVPRRLDNSETIVEAHSIDHELDEGYGCPFSDVRWVQSGVPLPPAFDFGPRQVRGRLIVASPGAVIEPDMKDETIDVEDLEGGRIVVFDFDTQQNGQPGQTFSLTLGGSPPQVLEEPDFDVAHEVAIIRRRTVNQNKSSTLNQRPITLGRSATSSGNRAERVPRTITPVIVPSSIRRSIASLQAEAAKSLPGLTESNEALEPFEQPYAQNAPRSQVSLQRAASNVQRHRFQALEEKNQEHVSVESSGNFLALPEYTEEPNAPLPSRFRAMAGLDGPALPSATKSAILAAEKNNSKSGIPVGASANPTTPPSAEEAFAAAGKPTVHQRAGSKEQSSSPLANGSPSVSFRTPPPRPARPDETPSMPGPNAFQSQGPTNLRFLERAYANAGMSVPASSPSPRLIGDWENVAPLVPSQVDRPPAPRQVSLPAPRSVPGLDGTLQQEGWDAISPLPSASHSSTSVYGRPPLSGPQHRFSTSHLNPPGHTPSMRPEWPAYPRTPSSADSFAPSTLSSNEPPFADPRMPPHMQAFRNAAAANPLSPIMFPPNSTLEEIPLREPQRPSSNAGYPITGWRPPAPSYAPLPAPLPHQAVQNTKPHSISNGSVYAPTKTAKSKSSGLFRRAGGKKGPNLLFGPEFESEQPGARPSTADSEGYGGAKSMFETKSIFTIRTKRGDSRCVMM